MNDESRRELQARAAELLGQQFNAAFMNLNAYGIDHPISQKAGDAAFSTLDEALQEHPSVTVLVDRGQLYIEKHPTGARFNPQRLIKVFDELGLESILFEQGLGKSAFLDFLALITTPEAGWSVDEISDELSFRGIGSIKLNYVVYRKITADEQVTKGRGASGTGHDTGLTAELSPLLQKVMSQVNEDPTEAARLLTLAAQLGKDEGSRDDELVVSLSTHIEKVSQKLIEQEHELGPQEALDRLAEIQQEMVEMMNLRGINKQLAIRVEQRLHLKRGDEADSPVGEIPTRVLAPDSMRFFLDREIECALRYKTSFSVAWISIDQILSPNDPPQPPSRTALTSILPGFYRLLIELMRNLDLVGALDEGNQAKHMIILPMTPHGNANIVRLRLEEALENARFTLGDESVRLRTTVTTLGFHPQTDKDMEGYLSKLEKHHEQAKNQQA
jgi:hypothetical protein